MSNVQFGWGASKFANAGTEEDSGISLEVWSEMSQEQRREELESWLWEQVGAWSDPAIDVDGAE